MRERERERGGDKKIGCWENVCLALLLCATSTSFPLVLYENTEQWILKNNDLIDLI